MNKQKKPDIFDCLMHTKLLRPLEPLYKKYKEILLYMLFGAGTTIVSFVTYWLCYDVFSIHELIANAIAWIFAVTFAYITNRKWVFESSASGTKAIAREASAFCTGRFATLIFEETVIAVFVTWLKGNEMLWKIIATVGVLILNYIFSKLIVFRKKDAEPEKRDQQI